MTRTEMTIVLILNCEKNYYACFSMFGCGDKKVNIKMEGRFNLK